MYKDNPTQHYRHFDLAVAQGVHSAYRTALFQQLVCSMRVISEFLFAVQSEQRELKLWGACMLFSMYVSTTRYIPTVKSIFLFPGQVMYFLYTTNRK